MGSAARRRPGGAGSGGVSGSRGPLGFGDEPGRTQPPEEGRPQEEKPWLPGQDDGEPSGRTRSRLPGIVLLAAGFLLLVVVGLNTLSTEGGSSTGLPAGERIPPFAAPLALSDVEGDVNLARESGQGAAGARPACSIRRRGVLTSCALVRGRPAVIVFFAPGNERCIRQLDVLAGALRRHPGVAAAAVAVRGDRGELRDLARAHRWPFPVAHDRDGGLANVYGVAVCPQLTFVLPGGEVQRSTVGELDARALDRQLARLQARAREQRGSAAAGSG